MIGCITKLPLKDMRFLDLHNLQDPKMDLLIFRFDPEAVYFCSLNHSSIPDIFRIFVQLSKIDFWRHLLAKYTTCLLQHSLSLFWFVCFHLNFSCWWCSSSEFISFHSDLNFYILCWSFPRSFSSSLELSSWTYEP